MARTGKTLVMVDPEGYPHYEHEIEDMYEDMLDDCYEEVTICGYKYNPSRALKCTDEVAYMCGFADYQSSLLDDGWEEKEMTYAAIIKIREKA